MGFTEAVRSVLSDHYADFTGRASRSEYWWFALFSILVSIGISIARAIAGDVVGGILGLLFVLALIVPSISVTVRRLHDSDRSGWWILIALVPMIGSLVLLVLMVLPGTPGENRFGPDSSANVAARFA